jgi:hypothetical protein
VTASVSKNFDIKGDKGGNCEHNGCNVYENVTSTDEARQLNGSVGYKCTSECGPPNTRYVNIVASGKSNQLNGHISSANFSSFFSSTADGRAQECQ